MRRRRATALAACLAAASLAAGCGDGDDSGAPDAGPAGDGTEAQEERARERANAMCRERERHVERAVRGLGGGGGSSSGLELTTEELVQPGIELMERDAERLRGLEAPQGGEVDAYVDYFDPILALARERLRSGRAGDLEDSRRLEQMMIALGEEQRGAARRAGMRACDVDLLTTLFSALGG